MAEFAAVLRSTPPTLVPRRTAVPSKLFTIKAAAAALVAVLSVGGIAAAPPGSCPARRRRWPGRHRPPRVPTRPRTGSARRRSPTSVGRHTPEHPTATARSRRSAPTPPGRPVPGLCRAWQAGQGADNGHRADSVAFQALVDAAGGADKVATYCEDVAAGSSAGANGQGQASPPSLSAPPTTVSPPSSGPHADPGPPDSTGPGGHGQGGPPTTTG
jgi:hypothetical protein